MSPHTCINIGAELLFPRRQRNQCPLPGNVRERLSRCVTNKLITEPTTVARSSSGSLCRQRPTPECPPHLHPNSQPVQCTVLQVIVANPFTYFTICRKQVSTVHVCPECVSRLGLLFYSRLTTSEKLVQEVDLGQSVVLPSH